jgi:predicted RNA-binding Zn-ribbon protein involved in translation (DUF1610 family)
MVGSTMLDFWGYSLSIGIVLLILGGFYLVIRAISSNGETSGLMKEIMDIVSGMTRPIPTDNEQAETASSGNAQVQDEPEPYEEACPACGETVTQQDRFCPSCGLRLIE